jgi:hypothetical protein
MSVEIIMPEYLHKDELQYELEARGLPIEGLNVAALRSLFRTSRDLKENPELLATNERFKDPASILSFCHDRFNQIKDLVDNTDSSRVSIDFPRYIHRLAHLVTRLQHLFQFAKLGPDMRISVPDFQDQLQCFTADVAARLRTAEHIQPVQNFLADIPPPTIPAMVATTSNISGPTSPPGGLVRPAAPFVFAKLPNPVHNMVADLAVTDGLQLHHLISFLRILVRIRYMAPAFGFSDIQVLQVVYGYTKGPLAAKTMVAMQRAYTLEAYHEDVLSSFIPLRLRLSLLNSLYYRPQRSDEHLSDYVTDIKEIAAVFRQDMDEAAVVSTILDGLNHSQRNCLVFADKPHNYAELDNVCIYAHNISNQVHDSSTDFSSPRALPSPVRQPSLPHSPSRSTLLCYRCNKPGHTRRTCRARFSTANSPSSHPGDPTR